MAASNHCASELLPSSLCARLGVSGNGSDDGSGEEDGEEWDTPIISLSKSSSDVSSGPPQRMELARLRPDLRKSASAHRPCSLAAADDHASPFSSLGLNVASLKFSALSRAVTCGASPPQARLRQESSSLGSGGSSGDTVIWRGGAEATKTRAAGEPCPQGGLQPGDAVQETCLFADSPLEGASWGDGGPRTPIYTMSEGLTYEGVGCNCANPRLTSRAMFASLTLPFAGANSELHNGMLCSPHADGPRLSTCSLNALPQGSACASESSLERRCAPTRCGAARSSDDSSTVSSCSAVAAAAAALPGEPRTWLSCQQRSVRVQDASTMTSRTRHRHVGVQTGSAGSPGATITLATPTPSSSRPQSRADDGGDEWEAWEGGGGGWGRGKAGGRTPVREVEWDEEGMTWGVYGAAVDPEELGQAIQKHLELRVKQAAESPEGKAPTGEEETDGTQKDGKKKRARRKWSLKPGCCSRPSQVED